MVYASWAGLYFQLHCYYLQTLNWQSIVGLFGGAGSDDYKCIQANLVINMIEQFLIKPVRPLLLGVFQQAQCLHH